VNAQATQIWDPGFVPQQIVSSLVLLRHPACAPRPLHLQAWRAQAFQAEGPGAVRVAKGLVH
jgi:hypothetical protein